MQIKSLRGMHDILPSDSLNWQQLESTLKNLSTLYGYQELRTPILEETNLFARSLGDATDVINKEMYSFIDRNSQSISLRPEGTASCIRSGVQHSLFYNQTQSIWYLGPMFRRERPQQGRLRQFHQFGIELVGSSSIESEIELFSFAWQLWEQLKIHDVKLEINTLGSNTDRDNYKQALIKYFTNLKHELTADEQHRLDTNPLRLLDSKAPHLQEIIKAAPIMQDYHAEATLKRHESILKILTELNIPFTTNHQLVRGLDYYNDTVFEWVTNQLGSQGTICAGGRYDNLITELQGKPCPAAGLAIGLERILAITQPKPYNQLSITVIAPDNLLTTKIKTLQQLRAVLSNCQIKTDTRATSTKNQLKQAIKRNTDIVVIIDQPNKYQLKYIATNTSVEINSITQLIEKIKEYN